MDILLLAVVWFVFRKQLTKEKLNRFMTLNTFSSRPGGLADFLARTPRQSSQLTVQRAANTPPPITEVNDSSTGVRNLLLIFVVLGGLWYAYTQYKGQIQTFLEQIDDTTTTQQGGSTVPSTGRPAQTDDPYILQPKVTPEGSTQLQSTQSADPNEYKLQGAGE